MLSTAMRSVAAGVRRGWWWMLTIALLAALATAAIPTAALVAGAQQASAPVLIASNGVTATPDVDDVVATMRAAAATAQVLADIARRAEVVADTRQQAISVLPAGSDRIEVTAADPDPVVAQRVARATRDVVIAAVAADHRTTRDASLAALRDQLTKADSALAASRKGSTDQQVLQAQRDTLVRAVAGVMADPGPMLLAGPEPRLAATAPTPTPPFPIPTPVLAFLVVATALAAAAPLLRAARGKLPDTSPAAWVTRQLGVPAVELGMRHSPSLDLAEVYRSQLRDLPRVTVVQLTRPTACDLGAELVRTAVLNGDDRTHDDRTPGSRRLPDHRPDTPVVRTLRTPRIDRDIARALLDTGPTVIVVQMATARRAGLARDVSLLRGIGADVVAVAIWRGRVPFDPARPWAPPGSDPDCADSAASCSGTADRQSGIPQRA